MSKGIGESEQCPCGSGQAFTACCEPYILGKSLPPSAEALMRSRYSAYATKHYPYILLTYAESEKQNLDIESLKTHDQQTQWKRLEIIRAKDNEVEFKAYYMSSGDYYCMHERSQFVQENEHWLYQSGEMLQQTGKLDISRNSICPCGSKKKFKRCCGR